MSEIKFACPHCGQHIACDSSYAEMGIECPSCAGSMVVPRLSTNTSEHGGMVIVASGSPPPRPTQRIPPLTSMSEPIWTGRIADVPDENPVMTTCWVVCLFATFVLAFLLAGKGFSLQSLLACVVIGGVFTGYLRARGSSEPVGRALLSGLGFAFVLIVVAPILLIGILFIGCAACIQ